MATVAPEQLRAIVEVAISTALKSQKIAFDREIESINKKIEDYVIQTPEVETYEDVKIEQGRQCDESLDVVKSLPDFNGGPETYVSWRQAAHTAYKPFENYNGSSKHYQAVAIIRNKIKGAADMVLSSFNTVLNFKAIIARLDFTYSDKRPIYLIEQELSILRQGNMTLLQFYDEIEKKLTLLTNKTIMTYDKAIAMTINEKYRMDALRVFISGTKKALSDVLFSARPKDLPSALALAQEVEANHERYLFASNYARCLDDKEKQKVGFRSQNRMINAGNQTNRNPHFFKRQDFSNKGPQKEQQVVPMEVDNSSRFRQSTKFQSGNDNGPSSSQNYRNQASWRYREPTQGYYSYQAPGRAVKRQNEGSAKFTGPKQQRINYVSQENVSTEQERYEQQANSVTSEIDDEEEFDQTNFFCYHS